MGDLEQRFGLENLVLGHTQRVELLVGGERSVVALDAARLAAVDGHAAQRAVGQGLLVAGHVAVERHLFRVGDERALECRDGLVGIEHARPVASEHLLETRHVLGDEAQPHLHQRGVAIAGHVALGGGRRLALQAGDGAFPEQLVVEGRVEHRLRVAPVLRAGIAARDLAAVAPAQAGHVAGHAGRRRVTAKPAVPEQHLAQLDLGRRLRVVGRHRHWRQRTQRREGHRLGRRRWCRCLCGRFGDRLGHRLVGGTRWQGEPQRCSHDGRGGRDGRDDGACVRRHGRCPQFWPKVRAL